MSNRHPELTCSPYFLFNSPSVREVLHHLAMGKNNPEIARELFISINTVTRHITSIFTKTSTTNRVHAMGYAAHRHLV